MWGSGNKAEDIERITELGFKVFNSDPKSLEAVASELRALGELTGYEDKANKVADEYLADLAELRLPLIPMLDLGWNLGLWSQSSTWID